MKLCLSLYDDENFTQPVMVRLDIGSVEEHYTLDELWQAAKASAETAKEAFINYTPHAQKEKKVI